MSHKLAAGMFPHVRKLIEMGVKPGSNISLLSFLKSPAAQATRVGGRIGPAASTLARKSHAPEAFAHTVIMPSRTSRLMPDVRDVVRQKAQTAGTFWKPASEGYPLDENHFRNRLALLGPLGGAAGGALDPITRGIEKALEAKLKSGVPFSPKIPWKTIPGSALKGSFGGLISGLLTGVMLDKYLASKLKGDAVKKTAGALEKSAEGYDPAQAQMLEQYYQAPMQERPYTPQEQEGADMLQQHYMDAQQASAPQQSAPPEPQEVSPQEPQPQLTADALEQQLQAEQKNGVQRFDSGTRVNKIRIARMFEQQGMDPVTAMAQAEYSIQQLWDHYGDMRQVTSAVQQLTGENWQQQQQVQEQQQQMQQMAQQPTQQQVAQQQDQYRQQAAPPPPSGSQQ